MLYEQNVHLEGAESDADSHTDLILRHPGPGGTRYRVRIRTSGRKEPLEFTGIGLSEAFAEEAHLQFVDGTGSTEDATLVDFREQL